jgi:regulatory factor X 1/2/3
LKRRFFFFFFFFFSEFLGGCCGVVACLYCENDIVLLLFLLLLFDCCVVLHWNWNGTNERRRLWQNHSPSTDHHSDDVEEDIVLKLFFFFFFPFFFFQLFPDLKTRRLGTRGNSKYHYYGIRPRADSGLSVLAVDDVRAVQPNEGSPHGHGHGGGNTHKRKSRQSSTSFSDDEEFDDGDPDDPSMPLRADLPVFDIPPAALEQLQLSSASAAAGGGGVAVDDDADVAVANASTADAAVDVAGVGGAAQPAHAAALLATPVRVKQFMSAYRLHSLSLLDVIYSGRIDHMESLLSAFWRGQWDNRAMFASDTVIGLIVLRDTQVYATLANKLLPNVLHALPISVAALLKDYTRQLVGWLDSALAGFPDAFRQAKLGAASVAASSLYKQASLNHLAQAARSVLANEAQLLRMIGDLGDIDVQALQQQASLVCSCSDEVVFAALSEVYFNIENRYTLEHWAQWLHMLLLKLAAGEPLAAFFPNFYLKWSLYGSLLVRHLTVKNAVSFGSFHLLRTLFDDYLLYMLEQHRSGREIAPQPVPPVALATGAPPPPPSHDTHNHTNHTNNTNIDTNSHHHVHHQQQHQQQHYQAHQQPKQPQPQQPPQQQQQQQQHNVYHSDSGQARKYAAVSNDAVDVDNGMPTRVPPPMRGSALEQPRVVRAGTPKNERLSPIGNASAMTLAPSLTDLHGFAASPSPTPFRSIRAASPALGGAIGVAMSAIDGRTSILTSPLGSGLYGMHATGGLVRPPTARGTSPMAFSPFVTDALPRESMTPLTSLHQPSPFTLVSMRAPPPQIGVPNALPGLQAPKPRAATTTMASFPTDVDAASLLNNNERR